MKIVGQAKPGSVKQERNKPPYHYWEYEGERFPRKPMAGAAKSKSGKFTVDFRTGEVRTHITTESIVSYLLDAKGQSYRIKPGHSYWFEYRCWESDDSADAQLWYRSHQRVRVLKMEAPGCGRNERERGENGHPAAYEIQFQDGFTGAAMEDELLDSRAHFINEDPPLPPEKRTVKPRAKAASKTHLFH